MKNLKWVGIIFAFLLLAGSVQAAWAQGTTPGGRDPKFEQEVLDRLLKISPEAGPVFTQATAAMDEGDYEAAISGYEKVLELAPDFVDALRRLSYVYQYKGDYAKGESLARHALELSPAVENKVALSSALLYINTPKSKMEALNLAKEVVKEKPDDVSHQMLLVYTGAAVQEMDAVRSGTAEVLRMEPNNPDGHFFNGLLAATDKQWERAEEELLLAQKLGAPAEQVQSVLDDTIRTQARIYRSIRYGLYSLAGWAVVLGLLFLFGIALSQTTLAAVNRQNGLTSAEISPGERLLRRVYRIVIGVTSFYFYLSIPILLLATVAPLVIFGLIFLTIGTVPIKVALILILFTFYTLYAVIRSLFARRKTEGDPGREISRADAPYLWQMVTLTARELGTRPVDRIFALVGTEIGVIERGGLLNRLQGKGERCLLLGLGALPGMTQDQLQAIIAHEYGHFNHADTAGGDLALQVQYTILNMAHGLAQIGTSNWLNPAWIFINGYYRIFLRITRGASRLQEILADRYAASRYGIQTSKNSLEHIVRQDLVFNKQVNTEILCARTEQRGLNNLFNLPALTENAEIDAQFNKIMVEKTSPYDSHPALCERLAFLDQVKRAGFEQIDTRPAWDLLSNAAELQEEFTRKIEANLRQQGYLASAVA